MRGKKNNRVRPFSVVPSERKRTKDDNEIQVILFKHEGEKPNFLFLL